MKPEKNIIRINESDPKGEWVMELTEVEAKGLLGATFKNPQRAITSIYNGNVVKTIYGKYMHKDIYIKNHKRND